MKKFVALLIILALVLSLAACGTKVPVETPTPPVELQSNFLAK